jgi:hypothetical protein
MNATHSLSLSLSLSLLSNSQRLICFTGFLFLAGGAFTFVGFLLLAAFLRISGSVLANFPSASRMLSLGRAFKISSNFSYRNW